MAKEITRDELATLVKNVRADLEVLLVSEKEKLSKAAEETPGEPSEDESKSKEAPPVADDKSASPPAAAPDASAPSAPAPAVDATPPAAPAADATPDPAQDPATDASAGMAELQAEYAKLSPEELKTHYLASKAALFAVMSQDAGSPAANAAAAPAPAPAADATPALKSESEEMAALKGQLAKYEAALAKHEANLDVVAKVVERVVSAPVRKAITSIAQIPSTETPVNVEGMSKSEAKGRLAKLDFSSLVKSDRDLVVAFDEGKVSLKEVAHLLQKK